MDYEKLHKDSLRIAQQLIDEGKLTVDDVKRILPDFVAETKDERIRKTLLEYFNERNSYRDEDETFYGVPFPSIIAYLEKQKENSKSADSIPSDCTLDAKCEDRWHKVGDFLPDDAREVLCKDAIGNFFIGRYYKCNNSWEVSMYDDVEKTNEDNPSVVMWTDIPSEKQKDEAQRQFNLGMQAGREEVMYEMEKEQKPVECIEFDNEFKNQVSHLLASVINKEWKYDRGFIEYATQQLLGYAKHEIKPAEWSEEDKQKLNRIYEILGHAADDKGFLTSKRIIGDKEAVELQDFLKSLHERFNLQPKQEWSEEEERHLYNAIEAVKYVYDISEGTNGFKCVEFLKSFHLQPHWKPSKEQINALKVVARGYPSDDLDAIESLLNDLQKL